MSGTPPRTGAGRSGPAIAGLLAVGLVVLILATQIAAARSGGGSVPGGPSTTSGGTAPSQSAAPSQASAPGAPSPTMTAGTASPAPVLRPATADGPVPSNLIPSLAAAPTDYPQPYRDHCHVQQNGRPSSATCVYGVAQSKTTIALFGDSHALSWFPAVERVAVRQGWRLLNLTMSACSPASMPIWNSNLNRLYTECAAWRTAAIARLVREHPQVVLVAGTRGFAAADASGKVLTGDARTQAWRAGMQRTLKALVAAAGAVIIIGDTPLSLVDPPVCLARHPKSVLACATPVARSINAAWLGEEQAVAQAAGVGFIDPSLWVCPSSPCPVVIGRFLVFRNPGHLTASFAATLGDRLGKAILRILATHAPSPATQ
jgi:SGNH domain-containing protein